MKIRKIFIFLPQKWEISLIFFDYIKKKNLILNNK